MNEQIKTVLVDDEIARKLVSDHGKEGARRLFNETFDPTLIFAILERIELEASDFNLQRKPTRRHGDRRK